MFYKISSSIKSFGFQPIENVNCEFDSVKANIKYIVENKPDNMIVYGFNDQEWTDDIDNYKACHGGCNPNANSFDFSHYPITINSIILEAMRNKTNILTKDNVDEYLKNSTIRRDNYDIDKIIEKVDKLLKEKK
jgi:hypothetical protein